MMLDSLLAWFVVLVVGAVIVLGSAAWFAFCLFVRHHWRAMRTGVRGFDVQRKG